MRSLHFEVNTKSTTNVFTEMKESTQKTKSVEKQIIDIEACKYSLALACMVDICQKTKCFALYTVQLSLYCRIPVKASILFTRLAF